MANKFAKALQTAQESVTPAATPAARSRSGRNRSKHVGGYFDPAVSTQLRHLAVEENSSVQKLLEEALDLLFHSRGKPLIAQILKP